MNKPSSYFVSWSPWVLLAASFAVCDRASAQPKESPLSFRIGAAEFTPGGFVDFENIFRTCRSPGVITPLDYLCGESIFPPGTGIFRSTDGGVTWTPAPSAGKPIEQAVFNPNTGRFYLLDIPEADPQSATGIYASTFTGGTIQDPGIGSIPSVFLGGFPNGPCWVILFQTTGNSQLTGTCTLGAAGTTFTGTGPINAFGGSVTGMSTATFTFNFIGTGTGTLGQSFTAADGSFQNNSNFNFQLLTPLVTFPYTPNVAVTTDPVSTATGELLSDYGPDLSLGGPLPLTFQRHYASYLSLNGVTSALGTNWMHNFEEKLILSGNTATVVLFGGGTVVFQQSGASWRVASLGRLPYQLANASNGYQFFDPARNLIHSFSSTGDLTKIQDLNGNALTVTPSPSGPMQVSDGLGRTLSFVYSGGKLTKVQDQTGRSISFSYSGNNLSGVTDALGNTTTFAYTSNNLVSGLMTSSVRPGGNKPYTQVFDANGRVTQQTDSLGNKTTLAYNSGAAGTTVLTDPLSRATKFAYPDLANLSSYTDAAGQSGSIAYDALLRPISGTDRLGSKTSVSYDKASGFPASVVDALGNTTTFTYATQTQGGFTVYNLAKIGYPDGSSASFTYDASGNVLTATDRAGKTTTYTYNSRGQVLTAKNAAGGVTTSTYNNDGTLASLQSPAGDITTLTYDNLKRPAKVQHADKTSAAFAWDALDQLLSVTDERGKVSSLAYDPNTNLKSVTDALNQTAALAYDTDDLVSTATDQLGQQTRIQRDAIGSATAVTNPANEKTSFVYDVLERLKSAADPSGKGSSLTYDAEGRLATSSDALSDTSKFTVDKLGRTTRAATPLGENFDTSYDAVNRVAATTNAVGQKTSFSYESRDLLTGITLPGGVGASFTWGDLPVLTGMTDPNGNTWTLAYDGMGRLTTATDPLGQATSYAYDNRNRVSTVTNPGGTAQPSYDAAGNLTQEQFSDGTVLSFTYDDDNRVTSGNGVSLTYDAAGRISSSNGLAIGRDGVGRITSLGYTPGAVTYGYDSRGLLASMTDWVGGTTTFANDDAQRLITIVRPNGDTTQYTYDADSQIASIRESDANGNTFATITLQRDALGRVTSADRVIPQEPNLPPSGILPLAYDAANQIAGLTYDAMGRLTAGDVASAYSWDLASRLTAYSRADGSASFTYDDFGQRISRTGAEGTTLNYVLNYALPLPTVTAVQTGGADLRYYIYLPDGSLLYSVEAADNSRHFYHFDDTGSTTYLTDDAGTITDIYGITPFGEIVSQIGMTDNPFTFQGRWGVMQETGTSLYYMRYRYYDSTSARFLSRDPLLSLHPRDLSLYQYARSNPVSFSDPLGLKIGGLASPCDAYLNLPWYDDGDFIQDGIKITTKFGSAGAPPQCWRPNSTNGLPPVNLNTLPIPAFVSPSTLGSFGGSPVPFSLPGSGPFIFSPLSPAPTSPWAPTSPVAIPTFVPVRTPESGQNQFFKAYFVEADLPVQIIRRRVRGPATNPFTFATHFGLGQ